MIENLIEKRKKLWKENHDLELDNRYVEACIAEILKLPKESNLAWKEVCEKPYLLIEVAFTIVDKERNTVPFFLNDVQKDFVAKLELYGLEKPFIILKGRQQGFTSLVTAMQLSYAIWCRNFSGFTIADRNDNTATIFNDKARVVYERLSGMLHPHEKFNNRNELFFDKKNSSWRCATATDDIGRSRTLNFIHYSEVGFYNCNLSNLQAGIGQALVDNATIIYESTANGYNDFKKLWDSESCIDLFYEWWKTDEYRTDDYRYLDTTDSWLKERIKTLEHIGLDTEQIAWYAKKYDSYIDKDLIKQEYPCSPEEAFISSGNSIFDTDKINQRMLEVKDGVLGFFEYSKKITPEYIGEEIAGYTTTLEDIKFVEDKTGYITIHKPPLEEEIISQGRKEIRREPYAIGGDTAGSGIDFFTAKVISGLTDECYATLRKQKMDDDLYAEQLYCLGKMYHDALIGCEINFSREPMIWLNALGYPRLYHTEKIDSASKQAAMDLGFRTTINTKPVIIGELVRKFRENPKIECDMETLKEMMTFVKQDNGSTSAMIGCHDDLVMASAIAHFINHQQDNNWIIEKKEPDRKYKEIFDDEEKGNEYMSWEDF